MNPLGDDLPGERFEAAKLTPGQNPVEDVSRETNQAAASTQTHMKIGQVWKSCQPAVRFAKKYTRELLIAFILAIVAAVLYEPCKDYLANRAHSKALQSIRKAVAQLFIYDEKGKLIETASGVFISPDGHLVTNAHVATAAKRGQIVAQLSTKAYYKAKNFVGVNPRYDIAVLQFDASEVPFVSIDKAIMAQAGQHVLTIGSPKGLEQSISEGVISYPQRQIDGVDFIQFTAPISPGSSGGGLFDMDGRMLGITTSAVTAEGAQNLNFAVPVKYIDRASEGAAEFTKDSAEFFYARGMISYNKKDYGKAEQYFYEAIHIDKNYADAYTSLGDLYYDTQRYNEGVELLERARTILPDNPDINVSLAGAYENVSRYDEAITAYKKALESKSEDKDALYWVCLLDLVTGKKTEASTFLAKLKISNPGLAGEIEILMSRTTR